MTSRKKQDTGGQSLSRRAASWTGRRIGISEGGAVTTGARAIRSAFGFVTIEKLDRPLADAILREPDEPEEEFLRRFDDDGDPAGLGRRFRIQAAAWLAAGIGLALFLAGPAGGGTALVLAVIAGIGTGVAAIRSDYLAWCCERRRWTAPAGYLRRLPRLWFR